MIDLYRFKHKSGKYLYITDDLKYDLTDNIYKALTFDSWDSIRIRGRCQINELYLEHIDEGMYNMDDFREYMNERYMVSGTRLERSNLSRFCE